MRGFLVSTTSFFSLSFDKSMMLFKKTTTNTKLPWLALIAGCLQWTVLILMTLILVCPSPWEHSFISLLVISPQQQNNTNKVSVTAASQTGSSNAPAIKSTQIASTNGNASSSNTPSTTLPDRYPSVQTAVAQSENNVKREPIEGIESIQQPQIKEVLPNSTFSSPLGGGENVTAVNVTQPSQSTSEIQLRLGPLGSCFRSAAGHESCTPAKLTADYQYKGLQASMNNTASSGINVQDILPDSMTFYATILLLLIIGLLCVCICSTVHLIIVLRKAKQLQETISASQIISSYFTPTSFWQNMMAIVTKWVIVVIALILVVSSAIQKYRLSNAKNSFNSATPIANGSIALEADTGSAFGFAWVSTILLLIAFWLQRTAIKRESVLQNARKELQQSLPQHLLNNDNGKNGQPGQSTMVMGNISRSATLPPYTPPPIVQGAQEQGYFSSDSKRMKNELESLTYGLPSLQKAYESTGRLNGAKFSPPFATYQAEFGQRQQQQGLVASPLRQLHSIPSSSSLSSKPIAQMPSMQYDTSSFGGNTYVHENTYDHGDHSYHTEVLADDTKNTCDCSLGRGRLDCSYNSASTDSRNRRSFQFRRQLSLSTFGHGQRIGPGSPSSSRRNGNTVHALSEQDGIRTVSPAPSYWTSTSAPAAMTTSVQQQEWGRQEKERERLFMAELRRQRAAMHSH